MPAARFASHRPLSPTPTIAPHRPLPPVPQGWDKTYCLQFVKADFDEIHFFGDKTFQVGGVTPRGWLGQGGVLPARGLSSAPVKFNVARVWCPLCR